ncbi:hypothetical protein BGZ97_001875 [Linnemannia gamsii]|uniref:Uncharacterized protein n=1 Tax=Linnemannia gamsii TaxID=64522 RepID=A0A9P6QZQ6_9FUNG|nr:hypothetical protein BGZ97_001875 [Linnemannia gamsii]
MDREIAKAESSFLVCSGTAGIGKDALISLPKDHADSDDIDQTDSALDKEAKKSDKQLLKLLGSQAPVSFERRKFPSTELCSVVSLAAFAVELKKMYKNGTLELQEQAERERKRKSNLNEDMSSSKPSGIPRGL